jgi:hypothetical protein
VQNAINVSHAEFRVQDAIIPAEVISAACVKWVVFGALVYIQ